MWGIGRFSPFAGFFATGRQLGFRCFELNHGVNTAMLEGLDPQRYPIVSVHEPCPADISTHELKARNWLVSSLIDDERRQGVLAVQRSIDLARELGAGLVVVHPGQVEIDLKLENELMALFRAGQTSTPQYAELRERLVAARAARVDAHLEAVQRSLAELAEYAGRAGVSLGLENRYYYHNIPLLDEMDLLLQRLDPERVGFWYDVGHAQTLDRLGFGRHEDWLLRFHDRMVGAHLHDVQGIDDHLPSGLGEVDWAMVAAHLPAGVLRTCEFRNSSLPEQVAAGLQFLAAHGCLQSEPNPSGSPAYRGECPWRRRATSGRRP